MDITIILTKKNREDIGEMCQFARQMSTLCEFPNDKQVKRIKRHLNVCIRADIEMDDLLAQCYHPSVKVSRYQDE